MKALLRSRLLSGTAFLILVAGATYACADFLDSAPKGTLDDLTLADHMCNWSRVEFMLQQDKGRKFAKLLSIMKGPVPQEPGKNPTHEALMEVQDRALEKAFGMTWEELDKAWRKYVLKEYPKK